MKVMVIVKASASSEAGVLPSEELLNAMMQFNEQLVQAGIMESGDGLKPSSQGLRVRFDGNSRSVTKGPFAETNELIAGYWVWNVENMQQALDWVKKCPNPMQEVSDIEIRPFYEMEDFAEVDTRGEIREQEAALRNQLSMQQASLNNYLFFEGQCEQALDFYQQHLAAHIHFKMRFSESPQPLPAGAIPEGFDNKIMHAEFSIGNARIFASDGCVGEGASFKGFSLALTVQVEADAHRVFDALAQGGSVQMPLSEVFWSPLYGQVTDKFGVAWMVMLPSSTSQ